MARAGRGGNTSLRSAAGSASSPTGLLLAVLLVPVLIFSLAEEDRRKRGIARTRQDIAQMLAIGAVVLAIDAAIIFLFW